MTRVEVGERLRRFREEIAGLSQRELVELVDATTGHVTTQGTIYKLETGRQLQPSIALACALETVMALPMYRRALSQAQLKPLTPYDWAQAT